MTERLHTIDLEIDAARIEVSHRAQWIALDVYGPEGDHSGTDLSHQQARELRDALTALLEPASSPEVVK